MKKVNYIKISSLLIILLCIVLIVFNILIPSTKQYKSSNLSDTQKINASVIMSPSIKYSQKFMCINRSINKIGLKLSTYMYKKNDGIINVKILDHDNNLLSDTNLNLSDILDNQVIYFDFENTECSKSVDFSIVLNYIDFKTNDSVAFWENTIQNGIVYKENDNDTNHSMYLELYGKQNDYTYIWYLLLIILISCAVLSISEGDEKNEV